MKNRKLILGVLIIVVIGVAVAYFLRPPKEASEDVQVNTEQLSVADDAEAQSVFRISQADSQVSFSVNEILRGNPFTAVGKTSDVAGDIVIDFSNPAASQVGQIRVNGRTLKTDSSMRDGMISREILQTDRDDFEFIEFQPTALENLPEAVAIGDTVEFQIVGDLTVKGITKSTTFDVSVTLVSEEQISGHAETIVLRPDYGVTIPNVPSVAGVEDEVLLQIDFVANLVTE